VQRDERGKEKGALHRNVRQLKLWQDAAQGFEEIYTSKVKKPIFA
jgi:hypothetical protein